MGLPHRASDLDWKSVRRHNLYDKLNASMVEQKKNRTAGALFA